MFTVAISFILSMANVFYRDVKYLVDALLTIWMFATSVVYPIDRIGGRMGAVLNLNPMTPLVDAYRSVILEHQLPAAGPLAYTTGLSVALLVFSWLVFHRAEFKFAESV